MIKQNPFRFFTSLFVIIVIIFTSCNGNNSTPVRTDTLSASSTTDKVAARGEKAFTPVNLDTLWVEAATFATLHQKLAFRFYFDTSGSILMNGWNTNGNGPYSPNPNLTLQKGRESSTAQYQAGDYLGNLLLQSDEVQAIQKKASESNSLYILFAPVDPAAAHYPGQVTYSIYVTSDDPHPLVKIPHVNLTATGVTTNPSPPGPAN
jgi:hypothetical protein